MRKNSFVLRENQGIPYYSCAAFESLPWLRHGFSTRRGGAAAGGNGALNLNATAWDAPERVEENRRRFLAALGLEPADIALATLRQIHSCDVHAVESASVPWDVRDGDALVTREEKVALGIKTADCFPLLLADTGNRAVGAVHSGWRGTLEGILPRAAGEMRRRFGTDPARLLVAVGPGIRACCFEVGVEVADLFASKYPDAGATRAVPARPGKYFMDLAKILDAQMDCVGIPPENRHDSGLCTCCGTREFFSYRAEGAAAGRMMSVIARVR